MSTYIKLNNKLVCLSRAIVGCEGNKQLKPAVFLHRLYWFRQEAMLVAEIHTVRHAGKRQAVKTKYKIVNDRDLDFAGVALGWLPPSLGEEIYEKCFAGRSQE